MEVVVVLILEVSSCFSLTLNLAGQDVFNQLIWIDNETEIAVLFRLTAKFGI